MEKPSYPSIDMRKSHSPMINTLDRDSETEIETNGCISHDSNVDCCSCTTSPSSSITLSKSTKQGGPDNHLCHNSQSSNLPPHNNTNTNPSCRGSPLFGRSVQQRQLLEAFHSSHNKTNPQLVVAIIKGSAGSGKTALIDSLQPYLVKTSIIPWVCDRQNRLRIGSGLMVGMQTWVQTLLQWDPKDLSCWKQKMIQSLEPLELGMLLPLMLPLFQDFPFHPDAATVTAAAMEQEYRFGMSTFQKFLRLASSWDFPMIYVLDDFHWVEDTTFRKIFEGMNTARNEGSFFIFSYNSDLEDTESSWFRELQTLQAKGFRVVEITLENLDHNDTNSMVRHVLGEKNDSIDHVSRWIYQHTMGNPLYVLELIQGLRSNDALLFDPTLGSWTFAEDAASSHCGDCTTVCEYLTRRLNTLSEPLLDVLSVAASLGFRFDSKLVSSAMSGPVESYLHLAQQANIVKFSKNFDGWESNSSQQGTDDYTITDWQFVHNAMQEAILCIVGNQTQQEQLHLAIGRKLLVNLSRAELKQDLLTVTGQIMKGAAFIKEKEKSQFAHLALEAARKAVDLGSFESAKRSISFAVGLTHKRSWRDDYDLTLAIYNAAAEVAYTNGDFGLMERIVEEVLQGGRTFDDRLQANMTKMYALGSAHRVTESLELGLSLLIGLGESLPSKPSTFHVLFSMVKTRFLLRGISDDALLRLPNMSCPQTVSAMHIMNLLISGAFWHQPQLVAVLATRMVLLSLRRGLCAASSVGFALYGMVLVSNSSTRQEGVRMGDIGLKILDRFKSKAWVPRLYAVVYGFIHGWTKPLPIAIEPLVRGYIIGLETGDIESATINISLAIFLAFESGKPLKQINQEYDRYVTDALVAHHQKNTMMAMNSPFISFVRTLMGERTEVDIYPLSNVLHWADIQKVRMAAILCDYRQVVTLGQVLLERFPYELYDMASVYVFVGIANIAIFKATGKRQLGKRITARRCLRKIERISASAIEYCVGKLALLQAELSSVSSHRHATTVNKYLTAISWAKHSNNLSEGAMAHERYSRYLSERGDIQKSLSHLRAACSLYQEWNAFCKVDMLQKEIESMVASNPSSSPFSEVSC